MTGDELALAARTDGERDRFRFRTAQGVHSHAEFRTGDLLALDALWDRELEDLLAVEPGYGVTGVVLGAAAESVTMAESSARAAALCRRNAAANDVDASVELVADLSSLGERPDGGFDTAVYVPKPYVPLELAQQRIVDALDRLRPGGNIYLAATTQTGLTRFESCLDRHARNSETVAGRGEWALVRGTRPRRVDPPTLVESRQVTATVDGTPMTLVTEPGLFAAGGLDAGTRLLCETIEASADERVLDFCCGYGPIGTYAALSAGCEVWLTDDDRRATACAEATLAANGVDGTVHTADGVAAADRSFDFVVCNPPTHAGDDVLAELFGGAADVLVPGGRLAIVHHQRLDLSHHLARFDRVERTATGAEHVVRVAR
mgnify:CR=1 FL=1